MFYWFMKNLVAGPILKTVFRPWVTGLDNIPKKGGVIIASNHLSFIDSVFLPLVLDRRIFFLAKSDYFKGRGLKGWATKAFMNGTGMLPIDRSGGKASEASLNTGLKVLHDGEVLGIYPEGTRSPDGKLYRGRTGVARMILEGNVPVVPVAMIDTEKVMPIGTKIPKVQRIGIVIGEPLDFSRFAGLEGDRFILRSITDEIMYELNRLSGQEYVDIYASSVKDRLGAAAAKAGTAAKAGAAAEAGAAKR
ncbi:lysophospholipid acyltransferase family protein [Conyzicola nivalis]|uniref:1-acyl-sn-glycerol-3-phosphate acyltransferase n=1 Tax=Conyzicola nivalis TaxID=1477021 RepID=A0A916SDG1_9MICO|nr:lysophospholipid acyltransferase family protein [Conyzicola nivalis]GGA93975.1 1-acyl-sn-glycerol-3-phosphate acyltransferase [Conyzicola nivalis]